jgi:hypothetical protein
MLVINICHLYVDDFQVSAYVYGVRHFCESV